VRQRKIRNGVNWIVGATIIESEMQNEKLLQQVLREALRKNA
jgi:hypothetical protein